MRQTVFPASNLNGASAWFNPATLTLIGGGYLVLATAAFFPSERVSQLFILLNVGWLGLLLAFNGRASGKLATRLLALAPLLLCYVPAATDTSDFPFVIKKFEGAILATILASALFYTSLKRTDVDGFQRAWIATGVAVLIMTILYKLQYGFFDRQVRFLFNGPIVFGWLMGSISVLSLYRATRSEWVTRWIVVGAVFALAVIWSASKGPLVALSVTCSVILLTGGARRSLVVAGLALGLIALLLAVAPEQAFDRFRGISDLIGRDAGVYDGSIAPRKIAWQQAIGLFQSSPITGVGLGNFQFFTNLSLTYPHNIFLESLAETGMLGLAGLLMTLGLVFAMTTPLGRFWLLFIVVAMQFSGDISYLRIALATPIALAAHKAWLARQVPRRA